MSKVIRKVDLGLFMGKEKVKAFIRKKQEGLEVIEKGILILVAIVIILVFKTILTNSTNSIGSHITQTIDGLFK